MGHHAALRRDRDAECRIGRGGGLGSAGKSGPGTGRLVDPEIEHQVGLEAEIEIEIGVESETEVEIEAEIETEIEIEAEIEIEILTPDPIDGAALEAGRRLFAQPCDFVTGAATLAAIPAPELPEVAFAGRSNVGKSSLVNALTGRRTLARVSNAPGRTQQLNFFRLGGRLMLVDLPGYGYARAPKSTVRAWTRLVDAYLRGRPSLRRLCLLIDARHGLKPPDRELIGMLDVAAVSYQAILTKADKLRADDLDAVAAAVAAELAGHGAAHPDALVTSARDGTGIAILRGNLGALAAA